MKTETAIRMEVSEAQFWLEQIQRRMTLPDGERVPYPKYWHYLDALRAIGSALNSLSAYTKAAS